MVFLDALMEKKDLLIYIDERIAHLNQVWKTIFNLPPKKRQPQIQRLLGRKLELLALKALIIHNKLKHQCQVYWHQNHKDDIIEIPSDDDYE